MSPKSFRTFGIAILGLTVLIVLVACGGGDGDGDQPTATATPTSPPPTATATPAPTDGETPPAPTPTQPPPPPDTGGAPTPEPFTGGEEIPATLLEFEMEAVGGSGVSGTASLIQIARKTKVTVNITVGEPGASQVAMVRRGRCGTEGQVDYLLFDVVDGESISVVNTPTQFFQFNSNYIVVHAGATADTPIVSCGNIPSVFG